ncbi:unnamed protein product [Leptosia nina]|uniref:Uncharacterized protein n=1 Tax=Leptosia nina TaxID=320188 RepID=A0AAV1K112_9NEOP
MRGCGTKDSAVGANEELTANVINASTSDSQRPTTSYTYRHRRHPNLFFTNGIWWLVVLGLGGTALAFIVLLSNPVYDICSGGDMEKRFPPPRGPAFMNAFRVRGPIHGEDTCLGRHFFKILVVAIVVIGVLSIAAIIVVAVRSYD